MQNVDSLFLEAGRAIEEQNLPSARNLLDDILMIDPGHYQAHNYLGWIYETKLKDFEKAKRHYELSINFSNGKFPIVFVNYAYLLIDYGFYEEATDIIDRGLKIQGADFSTLVYQKGKIAELLQDFPTAYRLYKMSMKLSLSKDFMRMLDNEVERVRTKMNSWQKLKIKLANF